MNGKELLEGLGGIDQAFYHEAEYDSLPSARKKFRRPILAAALIAMMLLLTGCAVVYMLHMQDLKVGEVEMTQPVFETDGISIAGFEKVTHQKLTMGGLKGTPAYQAAQEWSEFKESYDPDFSVWRKMKDEGTLQEFSGDYVSYKLYSQEMKDALDRICTKYDLKLVGEPLEFRTTKLMYTALGLEKILATENEVSIRCLDGLCWESGNFRLDLDISLPGDAESELKNTWGTLYWNRKDCFTDDTVLATNINEWKEWNYTTASGSQVLIMRYLPDEESWIICDRPEATLFLRISAYNEMTDQQMEQIANAIDFSIQPRAISQEDVLNQPPPPAASTQNGYAVTLKSLETDGVRTFITVGITAPEGVVISHDPREGHEGEPFYLVSENGYLKSSNSRESNSGLFPTPKEDGDGLDSTQDFVIEVFDALAAMDHGVKPFGPGTVWTLCFDDLMDRNWWHPDAVEKVLAEGEWLFEIPIQETDGDFREIEFVTAPINVRAAVAMNMDGTDAYEEIPLLSFTLRRFSATIVTDKDNAGELATGDDRIFVVMKDGRRIELQPYSYMVRTSFMLAESPIDMDQVDHVLLADGTKLFAPQ